MEQHKYNIIDIARLAQVSTATVSRVLHEKGGYSKETETRVRRVIAECGFQLNKNAQGLRTQRSRNIGVISPMNFLRESSVTWNCSFSNISILF